MNIIGTTNRSAFKTTTTDMGKKKQANKQTNKQTIKKEKQIYKEVKEYIYTHTRVTH